MVYVPDDGLEYICRYIGQITVGKFAWMALDSGVTVEAAATTALTSEITTSGGARVAVTPTYEASNKIVWQNRFNFTSTLTIKGCAILNQLAVGGKILMLHGFTTPKGVSSGQSMLLTMKLEIGR